MKIRENQSEIPELQGKSLVKAITEISQPADSIACRESTASVINPELLRHAPTGTGCDLIIPRAGSDFLKSAAKVYRQLARREIQISVASSSVAESERWQRRISNHTLHPTALRAGFCRSAAIISPAQSRILLRQAARLRLAPICCHLPVSESRG